MFNLALIDQSVGTNCLGCLQTTTLVVSAKRMNGDTPKETIVRRAEREFKDLKGLFRRSWWLATLFVVAVVIYLLFQAGLLDFHKKTEGEKTTAQQEINPPQPTKRDKTVRQQEDDRPPIGVGSLVTVTDTPIDFVPRSEYQFLDERGPGCRCSRDSTLIFPNGPYNVHVNEDFLFRYDGSQVCRKQGFKNFVGKVNWDNATTTDLHDFQAWSYWAIAGTLKVKFARAGDYDANVTLSLDCVDAGPAQCSNRCGAAGKIHIYVTE